MLNPDFVHLEICSAHSMLRGTASLERLCHKTRSLGMKALALTDINGLYGAVWFWQLAHEYGLIPLLGATVTPYPSSSHLETAQTKKNMTLLVKNTKGYQRLSTLLTARHLDPHFHLAWELAQDREGLLVLSEEAEILNLLCDATGTKDLWVRLSPGLENKEEILRSFAKKKGLGIVVTNHVHFLNQEDYSLHLLLRAISLNQTLHQLPASEICLPKCYLKSPQEMKIAYPHLPKALEATLQIAEECTLSEPPWSKGPFLPEMFNQSKERDFQKLKKLCIKGITHRYGEKPKNLNQIHQRLSYELNLIEKKNFSSYFLVVKEIVRQCPRTCGRGSAAASLVSYLLGITHVDPIRYDLFFERFLNEERKDPPDIDVDFPWDERDQILDFVFKRFGMQHTAMVSNHLGFRAKGAIHEVAKVYGIPEKEIMKVSKRLSYFWKAMDCEDFVLRHPLFQDLQLKSPWPEILKNARLLQDCLRHLSVHCGGVVMVPDNLAKYVPIQRAKKGVQIIQWEKDQTEDGGLVKIDLLGNRSLSVIRDALVSLEKNYGVKIDYEQFNPLEDLRTQELMKTGKTMGVFYIESPAMRQLLQKMKKGNFENLVVASSIIRPAANVYIHEFVRRLHGGKYRSLHPILDHLLKETFGIMVYQEDVSRVVMAIAGFGPGKADELRKIMTKKHKKAKLRDYHTDFLRSGQKKGHRLDVLNQIWDMILSFSGYSFCKAHSASYALVSFKSCYLLAHYPADFMAAVISNGGGFYSSFTYLWQAKRLGIRILFPDVNESEWHYKGINQQIRMGFMQLKGIKKQQINVLLKERKENGPFKNPEDFFNRVKPEPSFGKLLIRSGALDEISQKYSRPEILWRYLEWLRKSQEEKSKEEKNLDLFAKGKSLLPYPKPQEYNKHGLLEREFESLGFLLSRHPLSLFEKELKTFSYVKAIDLKKHIGKHVWTIGWMVTAKVISTKNNDPMEFITFEDTTETYECTFFPEIYRQFCHKLSYTKPYLLYSFVEEDFGAVTLTVKNLRFLQEGQKIIRAA